MPGARDLTYAECRRVLDDAGVGKVAVSTPVGPRIVAVNYMVVGDSIVFRTSSYGLLGSYARDATLAFEVDEAAVDEPVLSSVVAVGRALVVDDPSEVRRLRSLREPQPWGDDRRGTFFSMPWSALSGRALEDTDRTVGPLTP